MLPRYPLHERNRWLHLRNRSTNRVNLSGWTLLVGTAAAPLLNAADLSVDPGQTLASASVAGDGHPNKVYPGKASEALASSMIPGQWVSLTDVQGQTADRCAS